MAHARAHSMAHSWGLMLKSAPREILGAEPSGIEESVENLLSDDAGQAERGRSLRHSSER
jgi:hypothetical protein